MKPLLVIFAVVALAVTVSGPSVAYAVHTATDCCSGTCPDEPVKVPCGPCCSDCACCSSGTPVVLDGVEFLGNAEVTTLAAAESAAALPVSSPSDILHVPRLARV